VSKRKKTRSGIRPERRQDPRLTAERISAVDGKTANPGTWAVVVSPVELSDGRVLAFHGPQVVAFNLFEAHAYAERGRKARLKLLANLSRRDDGWFALPDPRKGLDTVRDLAAAVLFAFTALEGLGNHTIDQLPADATIEFKGSEGELVVVPRDRMERNLSVSQKLDLVIPKFTGQPSLKGDTIWRDFVRLRRLRDGLVHPKNRGSNPIDSSDGEPGPDPGNPGIYGMLMRGDADSCADDAIALVRRLRPEFLPDHVVKALRAFS
jgi:hypothetical protein